MENKAKCKDCTCDNQECHCCDPHWLYSGESSCSCEECNCNKCNCQ